MEKYVASTQEAEVIGVALMAYHDAMHYNDFKAILATYDLTEIDPEEWYPQQLTLDIQRAIKQTPGGGQALVSIGMKIIDKANFPPINSLVEAMEAFSESYPMNFRHQSEKDLIRAEFVKDKHMRVINGSPHSDEMIYGYIYALVHRFAPKGIRPTVSFENPSLIDSPADTVFNVTW